MRNLLGPLADEDHHQLHLGVAVRDRSGDGLQDHGLARLGCGHDEAALALADRRYEVDDPGGVGRVAVLEPEALLGVERGQVVKVRTDPGEFGRHLVDGVHADQRAVLGAAAGRGPGGAVDPVALAEPVLLDLAGRDVDVVRAGPVAGDAHQAVPVGRIGEAGDRDAGRGLDRPGRRFGDCCCHEWISFRGNGEFAQAGKNG
jgi:hypothetical protein